MADQRGVGWRMWAVTSDGGLTSYFLPTDATWTRGWREADCRRHWQSAPKRGCTCGLHVLTDLGEMLRLAGVVPDSRTRPWAVGAVEYEGPTLPGVLAGGSPALGLSLMGAAARGLVVEPASTLRARRMRLVGPLQLSPAADPYQAALRNRYGSDVV